MYEDLRRGQVSSQVSSWSQNNDFSPFNSFLSPYGLTLQQTINAGTTSVTIPAGITWVYAICVGSGAGGFFAYSGGAGHVAWGWTLATSSCVVGASVSANNGNYTRYGHILAEGGTSAGGANPRTTFYGVPPGNSFGDGNPPSNGTIGGAAGGGGANTASTGTLTGGSGASGMFGGPGSGSNSSGTFTGIGGNGGSGLTGGGGGSMTGSVTGTVTGGNGGDGINILTGAKTTGGLGSSGSSNNGKGGGGAGVAGNGSNAVGATPGNGGLGGGGSGGGSSSSGAGILYLYY